MFGIVRSETDDGAAVGKRRAGDLDFSKVSFDASMLRDFDDVGCPSALS